ncbi:MAG TPA: response regulator transcription factor [Actinomycetota bacterium]|nr:response regulator transcription factor [Actinomycetota bacterium]
MTAHSRGRIRVLLADDTPDIRRLLRLNLELDGRFEIVGEAADGAEAVALASSLRPDAVVLDLAMPVMDGLQAIPVILESSPASRILVLSGFDHSRMEARAREQGAHGYLEKGAAFVKIADTLVDLGAEGLTAGSRQPAR